MYKFDNGYRSYHHHELSGELEMMVGERRQGNPKVHVPPWEDPTVDGCFGAARPVGNGEDYSPLIADALTALHLYLPSNDVDGDSDSEMPLDAYACDDFRMFDFKVKRCTRCRSHDWTECPFAHPGEKARRRDPRKYHYSGTACPDFRKGNCKKGDACEFAHGVFECWLHPARYRTQPCKDGTSCRRRVCFFAHTPEQLRVLSPRTPGSAESCNKSMGLVFRSSPELGTPPSESPPLSPLTGSLSPSPGLINDVVASMRQLQLNKVKSMPTSWNSPGMNLQGYCSLPSTPTRVVSRPIIGYPEPWENLWGWEEEPVLERVESGRQLRAKMFEKLSKENPLVVPDPDSNSPTPDLGWVSELLK